jgi:peptide deformylase
MEVFCYHNDLQPDADRILRERAKPVKDINNDIRKTVQEMLDLMHIQKGVGLAGPQVGFIKRIFVTHAQADVARLFINPTIIKTSQEQVKYEEGCLSLPGIWADVVRPENIMIQAWNEKGRAFTLEVSGILARVIQHEYDHLDGILFIDRINEAKREKLLSKLGKVPAGKGIRGA